MNRLEYNLKILKQLELFFIDNPDIRFFQSLWITKIIKANGNNNIVDNFAEESKKTFDNLTINLDL